MKKGLLIVISAPSGAGKTCICQAVKESSPGMVYSVSYTTRPPRPGEVDGRDYHFIDRKQFDKMISEGMFLEYAFVHNYYYGTGRDETVSKLDAGTDVILDIDTQGAMQLKKQSDGVFIFILPPSMEILALRLRNRATDGEETILRRLKAAEAEISQCGEYDYQVINDDLTTAISNVKAIITAEKLRTKRSVTGMGEGEETF